MTRTRGATVVLGAMALGCAIAGRAAADGADPHALFAEGRYAAAAGLFETRWAGGGRAIDGVNAVIAWRTAGRYAHARALLARVTETAPDASALGDRVAELEQRLDELTATIQLASAGTRDVISIDGDPAERLGAAIVVDVGEHEIVLERERCEPWRWRGVSHPREHLALTAAPECDLRGSLHLELVGASTARLTIDGTTRAAARDSSIDLAPGLHHVHVAARGRDVADATVHIATARTETVRGAVPWRAGDAKFIFVFTSVGTASAATSASGGIGGALGWRAPRYRAMLYAGWAMSGARHNFRFAGGGGSWWGGELGYHAWLRPVVQGRIAGLHVALDFDPLAARYDEMQPNFFGFEIATGIVPSPVVRQVSAAPLTIGLDGERLHVELSLWPMLGLVSSTGSMYVDGTTKESRTTTAGFGVCATLLVDWRY